MVSSRVLLSALLHHFACITWAAAEAVAASSQASVAKLNAASGVQRLEAASLAFHTRSMQSAHLRANSKLKSSSSHGLRANAFRAARSVARARLQTQQAPAPLFIPTMGLANVTEPTPYPPPPPVLHPWEDHQPFDTAVGNYLISGFIAQPTVTPPPSQSSLDLAFACPALLTWPSEAVVSAPDPCAPDQWKGSWKGADGSEQINWATSCIDTTSPGITPPSISPITTYTIPGTGDLFGTSQERQTLAGSFIEIRDCGGAAIYTIEEKVYKQTGAPDPTACEKYKSCDGVIYFQYFVKDKQGKVVALTPYTTIFQDAFDITDPAGGLIVQISRNGWSPPDRKPDDCSSAQPRVWNLKYASSPPGIWSTATNQWPFAAMMTMLSHRDSARAPNGHVHLEACEIMKSVGYLGLISFGACCCVCTPMVVFLVCSAPLLRFMGELEQKLLPKRMGKPSIYGN